MKGAGRRARPWRLTAIALGLLGAPLPGAALPGAALAHAGGPTTTDSCVAQFQDDFESGTTNAWTQAYNTRATIVSQGAITGGHSLSSSLGPTNAVEKILPAASTAVNLELKLDLGSSHTGSYPPVLVSVGNSRTGDDKFWFYVYKTGSGPVTGAVRAYRSHRDFQDGSEVRLPSNATDVRIEWRRATSADDGSVKLFFDGALVWTSKPLGDVNDVVDDVIIGNTGQGGTGSALFDDVVFSTCDGIVAPPPPVDAATAADGALAVDAGAADHPVRNVDLDARPSVDQSDDAAPDAPGAPSDGPAPVDAAADTATTTPTSANWRVGCACAVGSRSTEAGGAPPALLALLVTATLGHRRRRRH